MPTARLPLTTYQIKATQPDVPRGSPGQLVLNSGWAEILARVPLDRLPLDAVITSAKIQFYSNRASSGTREIRVRPITSSWSAKVRWSQKPTTGAMITSMTATPTGFGFLWELDVTSWSQNRPYRGLNFYTTDGFHILNGSSASWHKPHLLVQYTIPTARPGGLVPNGGIVSVAKPWLTFDADEDMTQFRVQYSNDGSTATYTSPWIVSTSPQWDPDAGAPTLVDGGAGVYWRVQTDGPGGNSQWSPWAFYRYVSLPTLTINLPGAITDDGTPTTTWSIPSGRQTAWRGSIYEGGRLLNSSGWRDEAGVREWVPAKGVGIPDHTGVVTIDVQDDVKGRVAAKNAPTYVHAGRTFTTALGGTEVPVDTLVGTWTEPVMTLTGTRAIGIPDEVALVRDGKIVPIWAADGTMYRSWAPAVDFFTGTSFKIKDYTVGMHATHTWEVIVKVGTLVSDDGPVVTQRIQGESVWLIDPREGDTVEIFGDGSRPVVEQSTTEMSIVHVPVNAGLETETVRRRLNRTLRAGSVQGVVYDADEGTIDEWVMSDSGLRYRLSFGKVNWSVILGDYDPTDLVWLPECDSDQVVIALNWWRRDEP